MLLLVGVLFRTPRAWRHRRPPRRRAATLAISSTHTFPPPLRPNPGDPSSYAPPRIPEPALADGSFSVFLPIMLQCAEKDDISSYTLSRVDTQRFEGSSGWGSEEREVGFPGDYARRTQNLVRRLFKKTFGRSRPRCTLEKLFFRRRSTFNLHPVILMNVPFLPGAAVRTSGLTTTGYIFVFILMARCIITIITAAPQQQHLHRKMAPRIETVLENKNCSSTNRTNQEPRHNCGAVRRSV